jgi:hypothetical protein
MDNVPNHRYIPPSGPKYETLSLWTEHNERALSKLVPPDAYAHMLLAREKRPELFEMEEYELEKLLKSERKQPSPTDNMLRMRFWTEYDIAQSRGRCMEFWRSIRASARWSISIRMSW